MPHVDYEKLTSVAKPEPSSAIRERVQRAREIQQDRFASSRMTCNADMGPKEVREFCPVDSAAQTLVKAAVSQLHLSARAFHRTLKMARTISDLAGQDVIGPAHVAEAIQYRPRQMS